MPLCHDNRPEIKNKKNRSAIVVPDKHVWKAKKTSRRFLLIEIIHIEMTKKSFWRHDNECNTENERSGILFVVKAAKS